MSKRFCNQSSSLEVWHEQIAKNERRTLWVVILTSLMMIVEVFAGYWTGSMALLADGYHMASHAGALGLTYLVYHLAKSDTLKQKLSFGTGKLLPLGGYTSCIGLGLIAVWMAVESFSRFIDPVSINFSEAIYVAIAGLIVNVASIFILGHENHSHSHLQDGENQSSHNKQGHVHDHNHRSAVLHVMADALTSVAAIIALICGKYFDAYWLDPLMGIVGAAVILRWGYQLARVTARELLDVHAGIGPKEVFEKLKKDKIGLIDFHSWKVGPHNIAVQMVVESEKMHDTSYFHGLLAGEHSRVHLVVEQRVLGC